MPFLPSLKIGLQRSTTVACLLSFQEHICVLGPSNHAEGYFEKLHPVHIGTALSKQKPTTRAKRVGRVRPLLRHESWAAVLNSVIATSLTLRWRCARTRREAAGLCHNPTTTTLVLNLSIINVPCALRPWLAIWTLRFTLVIKFLGWSEVWIYQSRIKHPLSFYRWLWNEHGDLEFIEK